MRFRKLLDLAHRNHLLSEVILVLADATIPSFDSLVFAHHDVFGNLVEQPETRISTSAISESRF